jgi:hypothetical protein
MILVFSVVVVVVVGLLLTPSRRPACSKANACLMLICLACLHRRVPWRWRHTTYKYTLFLELAILVLWIPPIYSVAGDTDIVGVKGEEGREGPVPVPKAATQATLAMFAVNVFFRLVNFVGNIVILLHIDFTKWTRLGVPRWRWPFYYLAAALVVWTYPQSLEATPWDYWV